MPSKGAIGILLCILVAGLVWAQDKKTKEPWKVPDQARQRKNPIAATAESVVKGAELYKDNCLICHGETGNGVGPWYDLMEVKPADFTDAGEMRSRTDGELFWMVSKGRSDMPTFEETLNEQERWHLVNYLRTFAKVSEKKKTQ